MEGEYRSVRRVQPGWLVYSADDAEWLVVRSVVRHRGGTEFVFSDGSRGRTTQAEVRCLTPAEALVAGLT